MMRFLIRLVLISGAFYFLLPMVPGIVIHGNFMHAFAAGTLFALMGWLVESIALAISAVLAITTLGLALLWLIPAWILGFWLLPAVALRLVADFMPTYMTVTGWEPAIIGGLIMLFFGIITSSIISDYGANKPSGTTAAHT